MLSYVAMHSKQHKTTKVIKLQWLASIWSQNIQNYKSDQNTKTCIDFMSNRSKQLKTLKHKSDQITMNLHRFDVNTIKNVALRLKTIKTTQNYKSDHITMNLHRFHVKTIKTTQNYKNDQITMNSIDLTS